MLRTERGRSRAACRTANSVKRQYRKFNIAAKKQGNLTDLGKSFIPVFEHMKQ